MQRSTNTATKKPARRRRLKDEDYHALGAFRLALRRFLEFSALGAEELGLTPQQHQALLAIRAHRGPEAMSIGELADSLLIRNHSAVGLVGRLMEHGLVTRATSATDRRRVLLTLTPEAADKLEIISKLNLRQLNQSSANFRELLSTLRNLEVDDVWGSSTTDGGPAS